ncbi:MAG TPA: ATP-binding protein [Nitrospira sp.]|nr:ATP-binding protein [Nitrospira sp.]
MPLAIPMKDVLARRSAFGRKYLAGSLLVLAAFAIRMLLAQRKQVEGELKAIAWLLREGRKPFQVPTLQSYGDLTELNTQQTILRTVGKDLLINVAGDALHLIGTSGSVCEKNGDYASCLVASDWCRYLDQASRARCGTTDNRAALASGEWHCRESCREVSVRAMETGRPVDMPCKGGINLYAAPILVDGETVGTITIGYGDPPKDQERLIEVAERYGVSLEKLRELSANMPSRPQFIVAVGKARLRSEAILLGEIIKRKRTEDALADLTRHLEERISERTQQLRALATELNLAEQQERKRLAVELHDHLQHLLVLGKIKIGQGKRYAQQSPAVIELMRQVDDVLSDALRYTRTLVAELSPAVLRDHGLPAALKWLGEYMQKLAMRVTVNVPDAPEVVLPEDQAVLLFQSVRELLINASKYAGTGEASVTLEYSSNELRIHVRDHGAGFDVGAVAAAAPAGGGSSKFGLFSIRERMAALGGSFDIQSAPGEGAFATLTLPLSRTN